MLDLEGKIVKMTKAQRRKMIEEKTGIKPRKGNVSTQFPPELLASLFNKEFDNFQKALNDVREIDPRSYVKAMIDIAKMVAPTKKEVDIKHKIDVDLHELAMIGSQAQPKMLEQPASEYTDFDEIAEEAEYDEDSDIDNSQNIHSDIKEDLRELGLSMPPIPK